MSFGQYAKVVLLFQTSNVPNNCFQCLRHLVDKLLLNFHSLMVGEDSFIENSTFTCSSIKLVNKQMTGDQYKNSRLSCPKNGAKFKSQTTYWNTAQTELRKAIAFVGRLTHGRTTRM